MVYSHEQEQTSKSSEFICADMAPLYHMASIIVCTVEPITICVGGGSQPFKKAFFENMVEPVHWRIAIRANKQFLSLDKSKLRRRNKLLPPNSHQNKQTKKGERESKREIIDKNNWLLCEL